MTAIQEPSIQTNTESFTCMQLLAYNIVKEHVQQSANSKEHSLKLIINGEAGTGKSFLINAIRNLLQDKCYVTATTGRAAYNINGVTIHSLLRLPVNKKQECNLSGQALIMLQNKFTTVKYIIIH